MIKTAENWFEDWFDSPYYHILYQHRNDAEAQQFIDNLIDFLKPKPGSRILDLGCGRGRHSVYLADKGFKVTGIDLSQENISFASHFANSKLDFVTHDMREAFRKDYFHYVFNLFTSFGYFEDKKDDLKVLKAINKELKEDGIFVLDFFNSQIIKNRDSPDEQLNISGIQFNISKATTKDFIVKDISFTDHGKSFHYQEKVRLLTKNDLETYFKETAFKIVQMFGDYNLNEFNEDISPRLIIIAQKL